MELGPQKPRQVLRTSTGHEQGHRPKKRSKMPSKLEGENPEPLGDDLHPRSNWMNPPPINFRGGNIPPGHDNAGGNQKSGVKNLFRLVVYQCLFHVWQVCFTSQVVITGFLNHQQYHIWNHPETKKKRITTNKQHLYMVVSLNGGTPKTHQNDHF